MQTVVRILALSLALSLSAGSVSAELITWEWSGPVSFSAIPSAVPVGTLVTLETSFDPTSPPDVVCYNSTGAVYGHAIQQAVLKIGELTYTHSGTGAFIEVGSFLPYVGCSGSGGPGLVTFHIFGFSGPPFPPFTCGPFTSIAEVVSTYGDPNRGTGSEMPTIPPDHAGLTAGLIAPLFLGGCNISASATVTPVLHVSIAIKPGTPPPVPINLEGHGTIPVAILSSATFDARTVDPSTVTLAGAPVKRKPDGTLMWSFEDVNGDGFIDMVVHVAASDLQLTETDTEAKLEEKTVDGSIIRGSEAIQIVP